MKYLCAHSSVILFFNILALIVSFIVAILHLGFLHVLVSFMNECKYNALA